MSTKGGLKNIGEKHDGDTHRFHMPEIKFLPHINAPHKHTPEHTPRYTPESMPNPAQAKPSVNPSTTSTTGVPYLKAVDTTTPPLSKMDEGYSYFESYATDCGSHQVEQWCDLRYSDFCYSQNYHCCSRTSDFLCPGKRSGNAQKSEQPKILDRLMQECLSAAEECHAGNAASCGVARAACASFGRSP